MRSVFTHILYYAGYSDPRIKAFVTWKCFCYARWDEFYINQIQPRVKHISSDNISFNFGPFFWYDWRSNSAHFHGQLTLEYMYMNARRRVLILNFYMAFDWGYWNSSAILFWIIQKESVFFNAYRTHVAFPLTQKWLWQLAQGLTYQRTRTLGRVTIIRDWTTSKVVLST